MSEQITRSIFEYRVVFWPLTEIITSFVGDEIGRVLSFTPHEYLRIKCDAFLAIPKRVGRLRTVYSLMGKQFDGAWDDPDVIFRERLYLKQREAEQLALALSSYSGAARDLVHEGTILRQSARVYEEVLAPELIAFDPLMGLVIDYQCAGSDRFADSEWFTLHLRHEFLCAREFPVHALDLRKAARLHTVWASSRVPDSWVVQEPVAEFNVGGVSVTRDAPEFVSVGHELSFRGHGQDARGLLMFRLCTA